MNHVMTGIMSIVNFIKDFWVYFKQMMDVVMNAKLKKIGYVLGSQAGAVSAVMGKSKQLKTATKEAPKKAIHTLAVMNSVT